jgi:hypothetical protein
MLQAQCNQHLASELQQPACPQDAWQTLQMLYITLPELALPCNAWCSRGVQQTEFTILLFADETVAPALLTGQRALAILGKQMKVGADGESGNCTA